MQGYGSAVYCRTNVCRDLGARSHQTIKFRKSYVSGYYRTDMFLCPRLDAMKRQAKGDSYAFQILSALH
jgi:hypothetical protein